MLANNNYVLYNVLNNFKGVSILKLQKSLKLSLIIINISIIVLFVLAIILPSLVTWFVEIKHKDAGLPVVVMLTCYPSLPFAAAALFYLRIFLKNCLNGLIFYDKNVFALRIVTIACLCGSAITLVAGFFYLPFFVVSISAAGCSLIVKVAKDIIDSKIESQSADVAESEETNA